MCQCLQAKQLEQWSSAHKGMCHAARQHVYSLLALLLMKKPFHLPLLLPELLHTRLQCFMANMVLLHIHHVLFYCLGTPCRQPMHLSGTGVASQGHMQLYSQQSAPWSAEISLRKTGAGSRSSYFGSGMCKVLH